VGDEGWQRAVDVARAILTGIAAARATITYSELRERLGPAVAHGGEHDLAALLRAVSIAADEAELGLLSVVVVRTSGRPGGGWFRLAAERGRDVSDPDVAWRAELEAVWRAHARS
jgi:hypothetical protein